MSIDHKTEQPGNELARRSSGKIALQLVAGVLILVALVWIARDAGKEIQAIEAWIAGLGILGPMVFIGAVVILTSVFVPSTLLSALSGALFGLGWGAFTMIVGGILGAALNYLIANKLFRKRIENAVQRHPKLLAMQRAVRREGLRLQFMLRLAPLNAVSVNYVLGATGVRFRLYLLATLGLIPGLLVEVYFGHLAKHVTKTAANVSTHSTAHLVLTIGGFLLCLILMISIGRMAQRALAEAEAEGKAEEVQVNFPEGGRPGAPRREA